MEYAVNFGVVLLGYGSVHNQREELWWIFRDHSTRFILIHLIHLLLIVAKLCLEERHNGFRLASPQDYFCSRGRTSWLPV